MTHTDTIVSRLKTYLTTHLHGRLPRMYQDGRNGEEGREYELRRPIFNRKFDFRPAVIVLVDDADQVSAILRFANAHPLEVNVRVRSGGHDHEGECSGTDSVLIDLSAMQDVDIGPKDASGHALVRIGAGLRFIDLKEQLDQHGLGIPHGTCCTVGATGYTLGGGWGPWTRRYGMGCESLVGATLVLADGEIVELDARAEPGTREAELLWALRGGGGMSYGVVTELRYRAFSTPATTQSFHAVLDDIKTLTVLRRWEEMIGGDNNPQLIGCSLKISAKRLQAHEHPDADAKLPCLLLGFYDGSPDEVSKLVESYFGPDIEAHFDTDSSPSNTGTAVSWPFSLWDGRTTRLPRQNGKLGDIVLETEGPAPHKITSRMVDSHGWDDNGRKALIRSLQSPLAADYDAVGGNDGKIHTYITLLAISGPFYHHAQYPDSLGCAFPYRNRPFIIQYQAWWDQYLDFHGDPALPPEQIRQAQLHNRHHSNLAEDWIDRCRSYPLPATSGAFISFKDSAVPTAEYFAQHYHRLRKIKQRYCCDPHLLLQTAKTII